MKKFLFIKILFLFVVAANAQTNSNNLPNATIVVPFNLEIGYNYNTAIAFPGTIKKAYWGYKDIMAMQVPEVENILLVKASKKNFEPTNLHVFTLDGKLYVFNVTYLENPLRTTYDLRNTDLDSAVNATTTSISFSDLPMNEVQMQEAMQKIKKDKRFFSKAERQYEMLLQLRGIYFTHDLLFFSFHLSNLSNLDYDVDFLHLYIKDKKKSKRSSFQERELVPVCKDSLQTLAGQSSASFVVAVPKFTIPNKKEFFIEVYELNGGRTISMRIKNRQLLKAKSL